MCTTCDPLIVRYNDELTLINTVRLDEAGLSALEALGTVKHVVRTTYTTPTITHPLVEGEALPFPNAKLFVFSNLEQTEGVILLERGGGVLLTVDAVQSYSTPPHMPYTTWLTKKFMPLIGFPNETIVGPAWVKVMTSDQAGLKREFERRLAGRSNLHDPSV